MNRNQPFWWNKLQYTHCQWRYKPDDIFITTNTSHQEKKKKTKPTQIQSNVAWVMSKFLNSQHHRRANSKGFKPLIKPTVGNFDQEFVDEWYSKLKGFLLILMEDIATYPEKIIESTSGSTNNTETMLRNVGNHKFLNIGKIWKTNVEATKSELQQRKFKKFNYLKYKPKPTRDQMLAVT